MGAGLLDDALASLRDAGLPLDVISPSVPVRPGLYAVSAATHTWGALGLADPRDGRPLYVGKAESSLASRDLRTHFRTGNTGSSTLRRSVAGLFAESLNLHGRPRNPERPGYYSSFGLEDGGDERLTDWMRANLLLAVWPSPRELARSALRSLETRVLQHLLPPLNLANVSTQWSTAVRAARRRLADEARHWPRSDA